jgi:hypothetical protein
VFACEGCGALEGLTGRGLCLFLQWGDFRVGEAVLIVDMMATELAMGTAAVSSFELKETQVRTDGQAKGGGRG